MKYEIEIPQQIDVEKDFVVLVAQGLTTWVTDVKPINIEPSLESRVAELERRVNEKREFTFEEVTIKVKERTPEDLKVRFATEQEIKDALNKTARATDTLLAEPQILTYEEWVKDFPIKPKSPYDVKGENFWSEFSDAIKQGEVAERMLAVEYARYLCKELGAKDYPPNLHSGWQSVKGELTMFTDVKGIWFPNSAVRCKFLELMGDRIEILENLFV